MNIQIFSKNNLGQVRVAGDSENPLFCLTDICKILELQASAVMRRLEDGVITSHPIQDTLGRMQEANFINEEGLYDVILDSRKPQSKQFKKAVKAILKEIRQNGGYIAAHKEDTPKLQFAA